MKKRNIIAALLSVFILITATACGKADKEGDKDKSSKGRSCRRVQRNVGSCN